MALLEIVHSTPEAKQPWAAKPLVSVVITHFNYSGHLADAIRSVLGQTHENWECIVVDDGSDDKHRDAMVRIVQSFDDARIGFLRCAENNGQIRAFFAGLDETSGEFVCLLDPDDRYATTFLEDMLAAHLNLYVMCPLACADQILVSERGVIGSGLRSHVHLEAMPKRTKGTDLVEPTTPRLIYYAPHESGWHWTSTSAMMFRRSAIKYMKPHKRLAYRGSADSYLALGSHTIGGSLFLAKGLVYRTMHESNAWIKAEIYASSQDKRRPEGENRALEAHMDCIEAMKLNGMTVPSRDKPVKGFRRVLRRWERSIKKRMA